MRKLNAKWLRIARAGGVVVFVFAATAFIASSQREVGLHIGGGRFVSVANATLQLGSNDNRFRTDSPTHFAPSGLYMQEAWNRDWSLAWRPFHARGPSIGNSPIWHMIVFPLWPLMPIGAAIAAYAHGMLVGMRRMRTGECWNCGYDLRKTPVVDGKRKCPECGLAAVVPESESAQT